MLLQYSVALAGELSSRQSISEEGSALELRSIQYGRPTPWKKPKSPPSKDPRPTNTSQERAAQSNLLARFCPAGVLSKRLVTVVIRISRAAHQPDVDAWRNMDRHRQPQNPQPQKQAKDPTLSAAPAAAAAATTTTTTDPVSARVATPVAAAAAASAALGVPPAYPPLTGSPNALLNEAPSQLSQEEHAAAAMGRVRRGPSSSIAARAAALALYSEGVKSKDIEVKCGIKRVAFIKLLGRARKRGFEPGKPVLMEHVVDAPRSGRPKKASAK
ncbi:hypothetical protein Trco_005209 [Trichoderma cornu-damae]|uniref:Uncharacterized protein n=1 Tax=Trichoderma cornu-damae TaxID=654480 RepID=A0A9P8QH03_9HYPO|nr:hypothetical protein Trco_005209 [Trichoderma cornu-damae]